MPVVSTHRFTGLDLWTDPGDLPPGGLTGAQNVYFAGGNAYTRPGVVGLLTTPESHPIYNPFPFIDASGNEWIIYATGPAGSSTGGKIKKVAKAGGAAVELLDASNSNASFNINASKFRACQAGQFAYFVWGSGLPYRTDLSSATAAAYAGLNPPTSAPGVSLVNQVLDGIASLTGWAGDTLASASNYIASSQSDINAATTGDFTGGATIGSSWVATGANPSIYAADGTHGLPSTYAFVAPGTATTLSKWLSIDDPGEGFVTGNLASPTLASPNGYRKCVQYYVKLYWYTSDTRSQQAQKYTMTAYDSSGGIIGVVTQQFIMPYAGQSPGQSHDVIFDFPGLGTTIDHVTFSITGGDSNVNSASFGSWRGNTYCAGITVAAIGNGFTFSLYSGTGGLQITHAEPTSAYWGRLGGTTITKDYGSSHDWSSSPLVTLNLATPPGARFTVPQLVAAGLTMNIAFRQTGASVDYTAPLTVSPDGSYAYADVSATVPLSVLSAFQYVGIQFQSDLTTSGSTSALIAITSLSAAGNLPIGFADVTYLFEEINRVGDATLTDVIESSGSPVSISLTSSGEYATGRVVVPAPINASATDVAVFRGGGTYDDGLYRRVGTFSKSANVALGADALSIDLSNPYVSWVHDGTGATAGTLVDNTPDSFLEFADVYQFGRDQPPTGATGCVFHQNRIVLTDGQTVYLSWSLVAGTQNGLYFTTVDLSTDPAAAIKGASFDIRPGDNDPITAIVSRGSVLVVFKGRMVSAVYGYDPTVFAAQSFLTDNGLGCVAPRGALSVSGSCFFHAPDGVRQFDGDTPEMVSRQIMPALYPRGYDGGSVISASAQSGIAYFYCDNRLHVLAPVAGGSDNSVDYVFDFLSDAWSVWVYPVGMTSGASLTGSTDADGAFLGGLDGQLYTYAAGGDKATPSATATAITAAVTSRGMGQEQTAWSPSQEVGLGFMEYSQATRWYVVGRTPSGGATIVVSAWGDNKSAETMTTYTAAAGAFALRGQTPPSIVGTQLFVRVSISSTAQSMIRGMGLDIVKRSASQ